MHAHRFAEAAAMQLEADDTLASRNLAMVLGHLCLRRLLHASLLFSLLDRLCARWGDRACHRLHMLCTT